MSVRMPDRVFTFTARITVRADSEEGARLRLGNGVSGSGVEVVEIVDVTEGEVRTWEDDIAAAEAPDRDDGRPASEHELFRGYGLAVHASKIGRRSS